MSLPTELELAGMKTTAQMIARLLQSGDATIDTPLGRLPSVAARVATLLTDLLPALVPRLVAAAAQPLIDDARRALAEGLAQQAEQHAQALQELRARAAQQAEMHAQALAQQAERHAVELEQLREQVVALTGPAVAMPERARRADVLRGIGSGYVTPPDLAHYLDVQAVRLRSA